MPKPGEADVIFADNVFYEENNALSSPFVATTVPHFYPVARGGNVQWNLSYVGTRPFDYAKVGLSFKFFVDPITAKDHNNATVIKAKVKPKGGVFEGRYSYQITYDGKVAQDPELDVKGDMPEPHDDKGEKK